MDLPITPAGHRRAPRAGAHLASSLGAAIVLLLLAACSAGTSPGASDAPSTNVGTSVPAKPPLVVASTPLVAALVRAVGGDQVRVRQLSDPGDDPAMIAFDDPAAALAEAGLLVLIDEETYETGLGDVVADAHAASTPVLALAPQLGPIPVGGSQLDTGSTAASGDTDPHVWLDPDRWTQAARLVGDAVVELDGVDADDVQANVAVFDDAVSRADEQLQATFAAIPEDQRALVSDLPGLAYLADRYGFDLVLADDPASVASASATSGATSVLTSPRRVESLTIAMSEIMPMLVVAIDIDGASIPGLEPDAAGARSTYVDLLTAAADAITTAATT